MKRLGLAVVGAGAMGELHARAVSDCDVTALVCVVDPVVDKARALAERHDAEHAADVGPLLADDRVDGCIVAVPDRLHVDVTLQILSAGKHVLLEKPMAHTLAAAQEIAAVAERSAGRLTVAHILRHDARYAGARAAVADGSIGDIVHVRANRFVPVFVAEHNNGHSPIWMYQGVHDIDLAQWITGQRISAVYARTVAKMLPARGVAGVDAAFITCEFANGAIGSIHYSWAMPSNTPAILNSAIEVVGTEGMATVDVSDQGLSIVASGGHRLPDTAHWPVFNGRIGGDLVQEIRDFATAIREGSDFVMSLEDAVAAIAVLDAIEQSVETSARVEVARI